MPTLLHVKARGVAPLRTSSSRSLNLWSLSLAVAAIAVAAIVWACGGSSIAVALVPIGAAIVIAVVLHAARDAVRRGGGN